MKSATYIIWLCLLCNIGYAQNSSKVEQFLKQVVTGDNIVYEDSITLHDRALMRKGIDYNKVGIFYRMRDDSLVYIDSSGNKSMISVKHAGELYRKSFSTNIKPIPSDSLRLTEQERFYICTQIDNMAHYRWADIMLIGWQMLHTDTLTRLFGDRNHDGWEDLQKKGINKIYGISVPIFLRNDSYCFFYYGYTCAGRLCGEGQFAIYKKQDGIWKYWTLVAHWIS